MMTISDRIEENRKCSIYRKQKKPQIDPVVLYATSESYVWQYTVHCGVEKFVSGYKVKKLSVTVSTVIVFQNHARRSCGRKAREMRSPSC